MRTSLQRFLSPRITSHGVTTILQSNRLHARQTPRLAVRQLMRSECTCCKCHAPQLKRCIISAER